MMQSASRSADVVLGDIVEACDKIMEFTRGHSRASAFADPMRLDAILHNLHVIGEAVKRLPEPVKALRADVQWREIAGLRDVIAHAYFSLDLDLVWDAATSDVPALAAAAKSMRPHED